MMNEERKQELMEYAKVLATLKSAGLNYTNETNKVIKELNNLMNLGTDVVDKFNRSISWKSKEHGKIVVLDGINDRGVGKTTSLIQMSSIHDIPIIVKYENSKNNIVELSTILKWKPTVFTLQEAITGKYFPNGVLIDECVGLEDIKLLISHKIVIRGGYLRDNLLI